MTVASLMIDERDQGLRDLVQSIVPRWREMRVRKRFFKRFDEDRFIIASFIMIGTPLFLCAVDAKTAPWPRIDYFPIWFEIAEQNEVDGDELLPFARTEGTSELGRKLQWLFDRPVLRLLESEDEVADGRGPDAKQDILCFYGGLEFSDPAGRYAFQFRASDQSDFVLRARLFDHDDGTTWPSSWVP